MPHCVICVDLPLAWFGEARKEVALKRAVKLILVVASYICIACQKNVGGIVVIDNLNCRQDCFILLKAGKTMTSG